MTIKKLSQMKKAQIEIDLSGQQGNAFYLLGLARDLAKQLSKDADSITKEMTSEGYERLVAVFDREFGEFVILYTDNKQLWGK